MFVGRRGKDRNEFRMIMYGHYIVKAVFLQLIEDYHINRHRTEACTVLLILCIDAFRVVMHQQHHQPLDFKVPLASITQSKEKVNYMKLILNFQP